jgi:hypothetical protein
MNPPWTGKGGGAWTLLGSVPEYGKVVPGERTGWRGALYPSGFIALKSIPIVTGELFNPVSP